MLKKYLLINSGPLFAQKMLEQNVEQPQPTFKDVRKMFPSKMWANILNKLSPKKLDFKLLISS